MDSELNVSSHQQALRRLSNKVDDDVAVGHDSGGDDVDDDDDDDDDDCQDDPEELVRADARAVNCIRCVFIAVLVLATLLTAVANCTLLARLETRAFPKDFAAISTRLVQSFMDDLRLKMWEAYAISVTMTGANVLNSSMPYFDQFYQATRVTTCSSLMIFSPLLYDETARSVWETYAQEGIRRSQKSAVEAGSKRFVNELLFGNNELRSSVINVPPLLSSSKGSCELIENSATHGAPPGHCSWDGTTHYQSSIRRRSIDAAVCQPRVGNNISQIFDIRDGIPAMARGPPPYSPTWQVSSAGGTSSTANLYNQMSDPIRREAIEAVIQSKYAVVSRTRLSTTNEDELESLFHEEKLSISMQPTYSLFYPIFNDMRASRVAGTISFHFSWIWSLSRALPVGSEGIDIVLENSCGQKYTFSVNHGARLIFLGEGDLHDKTFESMKHGSSYDSFNLLQHQSAPGKVSVSNENDCKYRLHVYPSAAFLDRYKTSTPGIVTAVMVVTFLLTSTVFFAYDRLVRRLQRKVMKSAVRYNSFLSTLFPSTVRSRLFNRSHRLKGLEAYDTVYKESAEIQPVSRAVSFLPRLMVTPKLQLKNYLERALETIPTVNFSYDSVYQEPIADLFPHTTVFFADIAGFTAWSSEREPLNVFKLLETLYSAFDRIAARLGVFKVETVGDCYVAVTGLPEPQEDHAIIMAIFAQECLSSMRELTKSLESILGPSTASLALRVGMHSGPVIAGVLRGEKSRFQLFGDTMNTASRMESNGVINRIHVSQTTADLLRAAGKVDWVIPREDHVFAKGKGTMQTYWVSPKGNQRPRTSLSHNDIEPSQGDDNDAWGGDELESSVGSLIDWNVDLLHKHLQKIVACRVAASSTWWWRSRNKTHAKTVNTKLFENSHPRDEVVEALPMPGFSARTATNPVDPATVRLPESVIKQLRNFVAKIASTYHVNNGFHNFEHASHVTMSSSKLLNRIIAPDGVDYSQRSLHKAKRVQAIAKEIHETTFGIASDPLLQFATVFSALIHDVDHDGVPNQQLSIEMSPIALKYNNKTVAEQHSVDTAWRILMEDQYQDLRCCIYETESEMRRFRQLVVNAVIATDICENILYFCSKLTLRIHDSNFVLNVRYYESVPFYFPTTITSTETLIGTRSWSRYDHETFHETFVRNLRKFTKDSRTSNLTLRQRPKAASFTTFNFSTALRTLTQDSPNLMHLQRSILAIR